MGDKAVRIEKDEFDRLLQKTSATPPLPLEDVKVAKAEA